MLLSDTLILDYKRCQRRAFLNFYGNLSYRDPEREFLHKIRQEGQNYVARVLAQSYPHYQQPQSDSSHWQEQARATEKLMAQGVEFIHNGILTQSLENNQSVTLMGKPHLLVKYPGHSKFGNWIYIPVSIQLTCRPKPEYKMIVAFYARLLAATQETYPPTAQIILREHKTYHLNLEIWLPKMEQTLQECMMMLSQRQEPEVFISRQKCSFCHWHSHCHSLAQSVQHLSLVPGVTPSRYESLQILGVDTVKSLAGTCPMSLGELFGFELAVQLKQQAQSIIENRALTRVNPQIKIPHAPIELYFDIEAEPSLNLDYLLGILLVDHQQNTQHFYGFMAENPADEGLIWQKFLNFVNSYSQAPIFHYSDYEVETLKRLSNLYHTPRYILEQLLSRCVDLHRQVMTSVILPVESYSLKALANWLGFQWRQQGITGDQCVCWYNQWLNTGDPSFLRSILRYNEDDCLATLHLKNWLGEFFLTKANVK